MAWITWFFFSWKFYISKEKKVVLTIPASGDIWSTENYSVAFQMVKVTGRPRTQKSERSHSLWNERIIESWWCHTGQTRMYRAGLHPPFPIEWKRGPSGNSYAVYCFIIYLWCIWTTWTASILLNILYFIFYDSECLTVNKLEIKWSFQNTINVSEIFPARDSSSLSDDKGNL